MDTKTWKIHIQKIIEGSVTSLATEMKKDGVYMIDRKPKKRGFVSTPVTSDDFSYYVKNLIHDLKKQGQYEMAESDRSMDEKTAKLDEAIDNLIKRTRDLAEKYAQPSDKNIAPSVLREQKLLDLGLIFLDAASIGDVAFGKAYIEAGLPVNFQHPKTGRTALHSTCIYRVNNVEDFAGQCEFANMLLDTDDYKLLLPDNSGRLAYEMVYCHGYDFDLADRVKQKTLEQAAEEGVTVNLDFEVKFTPAPD
ncbi:MAG TPA: hypothetical protein PKJ85_08600 [Nitrosomonas nitrosa]|nr:hypothetical protein [Nitrosomonas nitrosa]